ncbi:MAG: hypothetical protein CMP62_01025 [Flavobacteriales bacterium]|nr:hypothetical protein [Flavobacteriales bacterium]
MNKSKELLIGLFTCLLLGVLYWGVNFLKGENLFSNKRFFYALYDNVDGLTISRPVTVNGFKVGQVSNINFTSQKEGNLIVEVAIEEDLPFSKNSFLEIYDSDLLGAKSLELKILDGSTLALSGDTLLGSIAHGLTSEVSEQFGSVKVGLDQVIVSFNKVLTEVQDLSNTANRMLLANEKKLEQSINSIESISSVVETQSANVKDIISNLSTFTDSLKEVDVVSLGDQILSISDQLELLLIQLNSGDGSLSKFLYEDSIYSDISITINTLDRLLYDIQQNPKKYINLSLWGVDKKSNK